MQIDCFYENKVATCNSTSSKNHVSNMMFCFKALHESSHSILRIPVLASKNKAILPRFLPSKWYYPKPFLSYAEALCESVVHCFFHFDIHSFYSNVAENYFFERTPRITKGYIFLFIE
ncbi:hypothetical protein CAEBREN_25156 [Caenorhabditis brenneri]|uniref:Uncharacterized protein n=1 Tax=Caenorhabditis brenneri TaxID=135651 RepID=G0M854_CAEBE|nr:hypothetical protein CAEBREN_25156 [Caenorhabditis brenneri]